MSKKPLPVVRLQLEKIVGGGQALGTLPDGRKCFVWGGLPGETVEVQLTKTKSHYAEGVVTEIITPSDQRVTPHDPESYLSTSPWQIMDFASEEHYKAALIEEAFELHDIVLPDPIEVYSDGHDYEYRNKVEFSFWWDNDSEQLDLAFFRRGSHGKVPVEGTSLARLEINTLARAIRDLLRGKDIEARSLKTLMIRCNQGGKCVWQLYLKDKLVDIITADEAANLPAQGGEVIFSDPRSPASRITERLTSFGDIVLTDTVLDIPFRYATEGFFQVNLPVYEHALEDMKQWITPARVTARRPANDTTSFSEDSAFPAGARQEAPADNQLAPSVSSASGTVQENLPGQTGLPSRSSGPAERRSEEKDGGGGSGKSSVLDLYSGVGTIGLTIGGDNCTLVEIDENAVREMKRNIREQGSSARAILAPSEKALDEITSDKLVIVDPPRAGLHADVVAKLLEERPPRIIYLSCNPVTQARDVALLCAENVYGIRAHQGYNFFPRTPHIEHLVVLDRKA